MPTQTLLVSLVVQSTATLFLFLVFLILYRHSRQVYFAYWTAGWLSLGVGLVALLVAVLAPGFEPRWLPLAVYSASMGVTAVLAFFARYAFVHGRAVRPRTWLLFLPVGAWLVASARWLPPFHPAATLPRHLFLALALWVSGALFWQLARKKGKPGSAFLAVSFALWGVQQAQYAAGFVLMRPVPALEWVGFSDTVVAIFVAMGMILFALEEDRARILDSTRKLEMSEQRLKELAMRDPLTGLFNRRHYEHVAPQLEAQAQRLGFPLTVLMADLDRFKETNDAEGHARGDQILRAFAEFLRRETRGADLAFRWGGDEFLVLMLDLPPEFVGRKAEQLRQRWEQIRLSMGSDVTVSMGWAAMESDGLEAALRRADHLMYAEKKGQARPADHAPAGLGQ